MAGFSTSYNIANQALQAFQTALDITGENVTNVNTEGYTRQQVNLSASLAIDQIGTHPYQVGTGVTIDGVSQIRNSLLDVSSWNAQSDLGKYGTLSTYMQGIQSAFPEPGANGISAAMTQFFNSWSGLASNPGASAAKLTVQQAATTLTQRVQSTYGQLQQQAQSVKTTLAGTFDQADQLTQDIAKLNQQISTTAAGGSQANGLLDQRNLDIKKLSGLVDIQTTQNSDGSLNVYTNGFNLVDKGGSNNIPRNYDASTMTLTDGTHTVPIQSGQITGLIQSLGKINSTEQQLDTMANSLKSQVNAAYGGGKNATGQTGQKFFNDADPQSGAIDFSVTQAILANSNAIATGPTGNAGDGATALAVSKLTSTPIAGLGAKSFGDYYTGMVGAVGTDAQYYTNAESTQTAVVQQISNQQQSVSGVNVDEEMSNMLKYQRSYEAAAKALSIFDQSTENLLQMI
jgi:flagellar hook-associated protein 1 FlgK